MLNRNKSVLCKTLGFSTLRNLWVASHPLRSSPIHLTTRSITKATGHRLVGALIFFSLFACSGLCETVLAENLTVSSKIASLTPVQTRIVTGNGTLPTDYAIQVGNTTYQAKPFTGPATGFQVLVLDRASLTLKTNVSFRTIIPEELLDLVVFIKERQAGNEIIILSSLQNLGIVGNPIAAATFFNDIIKPLGGTGAVTLLRESNNYSLIGVKGFKTGQAQELTNVINVGSDANITGAFTLDSGGINQTFVAQDAVTFSIKSDASTLTSMIRVGSQTFISTPGPQGATGGFQVVFLNSTSLDLIGNQTFWTNQTESFPLRAESSIRRMINYLLDEKTLNPLVFLSSIGERPLSTALGDTECNFYRCYSNLNSALKGFGGNWTVVPALVRQNGYYALVGSPFDPPESWGLPPFRAAEISSLTTPASPEGITGALVRNRRGLYVPAGWDPTGSTAYELLSVAYKTPLGYWPFGTKDQKATPGQIKAYEYISSCATAGCGSSEATDLRSRYPVAGKAEVGSWSGLLPSKYPGETGCGCSEQEFHKVLEQVQLEIRYMTHMVDNFGPEGKIALVNSRGASKIPIYATCVESMIEKSLKPPPQAKIFIDVLGVLASLVEIGGAIAPEAAPLLGVFGGTLTLATSTTLLPDGGPGGQIFTETADLSAAVSFQFTQIWQALGQQYQLIASDWPKLQAVGKNYEPLIQPGWDFSNLAQALTVLDISLQREFYRGLMAGGLYRVLSFEAVPSPDTYKGLPSTLSFPFKTWPEQAVFSPPNQSNPARFDNFVLVEKTPSDFYGNYTNCGRFVKQNPSFNAIVSSLFTPSDLPPPGETCTQQNLGLTPAEVFINWPLEHIPCSP